MYERTNGRRKRYLVGRIGKLKLMILPTPEILKCYRVWQAVVPCAGAVRDFIMAAVPANTLPL